MGWAGFVALAGGGLYDFTRLWPNNVTTGQTDREMTLRRVVPGRCVSSSVCESCNVCLTPEGPDVLSLA